jgi:hypothetical protein
MSSKLQSVVTASFAALLAAGPPGTVSAAGEPAPAAACSAAMPPELAAPGEHRLAFELRAEGWQIYACTDSAGAARPAWALRAPEATLVDERGRPAGKHGAGPTWEALDGSSVVGAKVEATTPDRATIPWLLLRAVSHGAAPGRMADVTFVQRIDTSGGVAPSEGCSAATVGTVVRVPYRAVYCFHRSARSRPAAAITATAPSHGFARE